MVSCEQTEETLLPFAQTQTNLESSLECSASLPAQKSGVASPSQTTRLHSRPINNMVEKLTVEECQAHIRDIRVSHGADARNESERFLRRGYESMLKLLSAQLYSEPSHFLFELIQNADDNVYTDGDQPQAALAYRSDGLLLFGCNEQGFSKANVSAICDMNQSTKTLLKEGKKSCIGEKGIGFKSVFKVADKVWISSNNFSFMFDKSKPLGMVDPLTKVLEPSSFMFLRRLSKIRVVRLDDSGDTFDEIIMSHDQRAFTNDLQLVTTTKTKGTRSRRSRYVVSDYTAREMPSTELRQGVTETSIKLAFPLDDQQQPLIAKQDVYAFLPVCSSGLPFLIQADFLLVASRQGIDESQPWNRRLQDHIIYALIQAFQRLNDSHLKYRWPAYLPEVQVAHKFFDKMKDKFLDRMKDVKILESRAGEFAKPKVMMLVPDQYKDEVGNPLLTPTNDRYLSTKYDPNHVSSLVTQALDGKKFFEILKNYVMKQSEEFRSRPDAWHGRVSTVLMLEQKQFNLDELLILPIVPLDDGLWIPAKSRVKLTYSRAATRNTPPVAFYLPRSDANIVIPKGVSLSIVEHNASRNEERRSFLRRIGAQDLDYEDVLQGIIKQHRESMSNADVDLLLSHAQYVFSMPSASKMAQNLSTILWLADSRGEQFRGIELHMDNPFKVPVSQIFAQNPTVIRFIHPKYLGAYHGNVELRTRWLAWLRECLGVHDVPRLANKMNKGLSAEFEWLVNNLPSVQWLACIRVNWEDYHLSKAPKLGDVRIPSDEVRSRIGSLVVDCTDGRRAKLKDTILPTLRSAVMTIQHMGFHFLDVKDEQHNDWTKLSTFGVITHRDLDFCLKLLMKFPETGMIPDKMTVIKLYRDIHNFCEPSLVARERTRTAFRDLPLIFLPESAQWALENSRIFPVKNTQKQLVLVPGSDPKWFIPDGKNLSKYIMKPLLESIEIWAVESIKVHRSIRLDNQEICGKPLPANIMLGKDQRVFAPIQDLEDNSLNHYELSEKLVTLCKLEKVPKELVLGILTTSSTQQIEDMLEEHGVIFDKVELQKLTNNIIGGLAGAASSSRRVSAQQTPPGMVSDNDSSSSGDSDSSSLADLKAIGFRVKLARKIKPVSASRANGQNHSVRPRFRPEPSSDENDTEQLLDDGDWNKGTAPMSNHAAPYRRSAKSSDGFSYQARSNNFGNKLAMSDEDINDIDSEESEIVTDTMQRAQASEYRKLVSASETSYEDPQVIRIGEQGEMKMYGFFKNLLGDYFTDDMWTSHASAKYTDQTFDGDDSQFADFTIRDLSGRFTDWLVERGCKKPKEWLGKNGKDSITYSIEVKATYGPRTEPFHISQNQIDMAKEQRLQGDGVPQKVYVVMRVSNLAGSGHSGSAQVHPFVDPYGLFEQGALTYISPGGYLVFSDQ
ncbi:hypothetical protein D6D26_04062 [Aureobasidium pullulans]|nr:hypothetical protein D6D26_04062 [Aureobasidium pullulans]